MFCEVGAYDGFKSSNTLLFEELGWEGILVEPIPRLAYVAQEKVGGRRALTWCCAAGPRGYRMMPVNRADLGLCGFDRPGDHQVPVVVCPLCELIKASGYEKVNLLSIDTEGTELDVWNTRGDYFPDIVIIEHQTCNEPSQADAINGRLTLDGYLQVHRTAHNLIFIYGR